MSIGLYIVLAPLYLKSVRKLQEKRFVFVKILAIIIPENGAKVSKIKCFQFAQQTLIGAPLPIQIIVTSKLSKKENLWLGNLTNHLKNIEEVQDLLSEYKKHKKDTLYESVMDIIVKANQKLFEKEGDAMCKALEELMKDELEAQMLKGKAIGAAQGENRVNQLNQKLINLGRIDDILKSVTDKLYQQKLFKEFNL